MSQWKNTDDAGNSVMWVARSLNVGSGKANQVANNTALFDNVTPNTVEQGMTHGMFGVDTNEQTASLSKITHAGYVLKRTGSGGRAGRVTYETLVAMGSLTGDSDSNTVPNYALLFSTSPAPATSNSTAAQVANFGVVGYSAPAGATITYQWYGNTGGGFTILSNGATYGNVATANLTVIVTTGLNGAQYRVRASAAGAQNTDSNSAILTVTT